MSLNQNEKKKFVDAFGRHPRDTGSSDVQVAILTEQINRLTEHMKSHRKDFRTQRSLVMMVSKRQKHLNYLKKTKPDRYRQVVEKLGLRK